MGTLISLPSPVPRQGQRLFKPDYFDHLKESQKARDAVIQVHDALCSQRGIWSTENIRLLLPSILRYKASIGALLHHVIATSKWRPSDALRLLPSQHVLFSTFHWTGNAPAAAATAMDEDDVGTQHFTPTEVLPRPKMVSKDGKDTLNADDNHWWEEDDITEF
jgi:cell cycle checkpoint protein